MWATGYFSSDTACTSKDLMNRNATILSNVTTTISANTTTSNDITSYLGNQFSNVVSGVASQLTCLFKCCSKED